MKANELKHKDWVVLTTRKVLGGGGWGEGGVTKCKKVNDYITPSQPKIYFRSLSKKKSWRCVGLLTPLFRYNFAIQG